MYTLGFFHSLSGSDLTFGKKLMSDLASANSYYEVTNANELIFTFGEIAEDIVNTLKPIRFNYYNDNYSTICYYTDDYFSDFPDDSYTYSPNLSTMSLCFAMSAFGYPNGSSYTDSSRNAKNLLRDIGMAEDSKSTNEWFEVKPTTDSIGVIAGNKTITVDHEKYTLIAVAVRGGGYEQEWASNFTIGTTGQHQGFDTAKNNVIKFLKEYISEQKITGPVKLWITGYSRAAATANLVAGAIDQGTILSQNISYKLKDVYSYCFETPAGALTARVKGNSVYNNIFNIINQNEPVTYVAPAALGFGRYGVDKYLPSAQATGSMYNYMKSNMLRIHNSLDGAGDYTVDDFQMKKIKPKNWLPGGEKISYIQDDTDNNLSQGVFLTNYVRYLSRDFIGNRTNYVDNYQNEIREICSVMFGCTDEQLEKVIDSFVEQAKSNWGYLLWSYIYNTGIKGLVGKGDEQAALKIISEWLLRAVMDAGITNYNSATIERAGIYLADLLLALASNHPNYTSTAVLNASGLSYAHQPHLCLAWLISMDNNYNKDSLSMLNNGGYRIIRINCEVDIKVKDIEGNLVASIVDEKPEKLLDGCYPDLMKVDKNLLFFQ